MLVNQRERFPGKVTHDENENRTLRENSPRPSPTQSIQNRAKNPKKNRTQLATIPNQDRDDGAKPIPCPGFANGRISCMNVVKSITQRQLF